MAPKAVSAPAILQPMWSTWTVWAIVNLAPSHWMAPMPIAVTGGGPGVAVSRMRAARPRDGAKCNAAAATRHQVTWDAIRLRIDPPSAPGKHISIPQHNAQAYLPGPCIDR